MNQRIFTSPTEIYTVNNRHYWASKDGTVYEILVDTQEFSPLAKREAPVMLSALAEIINRHDRRAHADFRWLGAD